MCAGAFLDFIVVVNSFLLLGCFYFFLEPVTICHSFGKKKKKEEEKKCTRHGIIVNMKGCVKGPARFLEDCILKSELVSTVSRLA